MAESNPTSDGAVSVGTVSLVDNNTGGNAGSEELEVLQGTLGPKVIDVGKLYGSTGYFTYDPGFMATASCQCCRRETRSL